LGVVDDIGLASFPTDRLGRLTRGEESDPFGVLGPHSYRDRLTVTAFDPGAEAMELIAGGRAAPMEPLPGLPGVFAGAPPAAGSYRLRGKGHGGSWEVDDPYRYGPVLGELDEYLLGEGSVARLWQKLGAHVMEHEGAQGTHFAVWAPNAGRVSVVGQFNAWDSRRHPMRARGATGVWEIFIPGVGDGASYKYEIRTRDGRILPQKADPVGFGAEHPPATASVVRDLSGYGWHDADWMAGRAAKNDRR